MWLNEDGADTEKIKIKFYDEDWRGVHACTPI